MGKEAAAIADDAHLDDSFPKVHKIDWESQKGVLKALAKYNKNDQYEGLMFGQQVILLANNFTPTDLRPLLSNTTKNTGQVYRIIDWDRYKSTKRISPELSRLIVKIVNAKADLAVPSKIVVKYFKFICMKTFLSSFTDSQSIYFLF